MFALVGLGEWDVRDNFRLAHRVLKKAVLVERGSRVDLVCFVYLVDLVHLVSFVQLNKRDKPNKPNNGLLTLADFFSILLVGSGTRGS